VHDLHARFHLSRRLIGDFVVVDTVHSGLQDVLFVIDLEDFDSGTQLLGCFSDFCALPPDSLRSGTLIREILIFWGVNTPVILLRIDEGLQAFAVKALRG
jgi:hypothetical protein